MTPTNWQELWGKYERRQQANYAYKNVIVGFNKLAQLFFSWMQEHKKFEELVPDTDNSSTTTAWLKEFEPTLELPPIRVRMALKWGRELAQEKFKDEPGPPRPIAKAVRKEKVVPPPTSPTPTPPTSPAPEPPMSVVNNPPEDEDINGPELDEDDGPEPEEEEVPLRRRAPLRAQQVVMVAAPPPRRPRMPVGPPRSKLVPTTEAIRISKRGTNGHLDFVGEYNTNDLNGMSLEQFIANNIHEEHGELSGTTAYEVVALDSQGRPRGQATSIRISSGNTQVNSNDPIDQVRSAVELVNELTQSQADREAANRAILDEAKRKAMGSGDTGTFMMMMMMERMMGGNQRNDTELVMKIADKLGIGERAHAPPAPVPPPWAMHPMDPPQRHNSGMDKLVELMVAKAANPPTLADSLKELMLFQQMMNPRGAVDPEIAALKLEVAALRGQLGASHATPGIEGALGNFEKLTAVVKQLAPQLNAGGITGAIQSIMTPDLMKAAGNMLAQGLNASGAVGPAAAGMLPPPVAAVPAALPAAPPKPTVIEPPPAVRERVNALRIAQTRDIQVGSTVELIQTMYLGPYREMLEPVLSALLAGKVDPARQSVAAILAETRSELNQPTFVDDVLREMFKRAGAVEFPPELRPANEGVRKEEQVKNGANGADVISTAAQVAYAAQIAQVAYAAQIEAAAKVEVEANAEARSQKEAPHVPHAPEVPTSMSSTPVLEPAGVST